MAFVNEIVSDDDKNNPLFQKESPFPPRGQKLRPYKWTIDRERDFIFKAAARNDRERPDCFVYQWMGKLGAVMAQESFTVIEPLQTRPGYLTDYTWTLLELHIPQACKDHEDEIRQLVTEAFEAFGHNYGQGAVRKTTVVWDRCAVVVGGSSYVRI